MIRMNIVDVMIVLLLIYGGIIGFKKGFTSELISCVGVIAALIIAYLLKNPVSEIFYNFLPFFKFGGIIKGVTVLNILLYEALAFSLIFGILMIVFKVVLLASKIFEKILKATIILGIPSKLLGMLLGVVEYFVIAFVLLFVLSLPVFHFEEVRESELKDKMLTSVPILNTGAKKVIDVANAFVALKDKYKEIDDASSFNLETLDLFLEYKVISVGNVEKLIAKDKLSLDNVETILKKYR